MRKHLGALVVLGILGLPAGRGAEPIIDGKSIGEWRTQLGDSDAVRRVDAAKAIGKLGAGADVAAAELYDALREKRGRWVVIQTLVHIGPKVIPFLEQKLGADRHLDQHVLEVLFRLGHESIPALTRALRHEKHPIREQAANYLGEFGAASASAVPALVAALVWKNPTFSIVARGGLLEGPRIRVSDDSFVAQAAAALALARIGGPGIPALIQLLEPRHILFSGPAIRNLISELPDLWPSLVHACEGQQPVVLALCLGLQLPLLFDTLVLHDQYVHQLTAWGLGVAGLRSDEVTRILITRTEDGDRFVRAESLRALRELGADLPEVRRVLLNRLYDRDPGLWLESMKHVRTMRSSDKQTVGRLLELVSDIRSSGLVSTLQDGMVDMSRGIARSEGVVPSASIGEVALETLLQLGPDVESQVITDVFPGLMAQLLDTDPTARHRALGMIKIIGRRAKGALPAFQRLVEDPGVPSKGIVFNAIACLGPEGLDTLVQLYPRQSSTSKRELLLASSSADWRNRNQTNRLLPLFIEAVKEKDESLRDSAISQLLNRRSPCSSANVRLLEELVSGKDRIVALAAARVLAACDISESAVMDLCKSSLQRREGVEVEHAFLVIDLLGPRAASVVPDLVGFLEGDAATKRTLGKHATRVLGNIGPKAGAAAPALVQLIEDASSPDDLRIEAIAALGKIGAVRREVVPALIGLLEDRSAAEKVRIEAVDALGKIGAADKAVVAALISELSYMPPEAGSEVSDHACCALAAIGREASEAVPALVVLLKAQRSWPAVAALRRIGPPAKAAVPTLLRMLEMQSTVDGETDRWMTAEILRALAAIGPSADQTVPYLKSVLKCVSGETKSRIAYTLYLLTGDEKTYLPLLLDVIKDAHQPLSHRWLAVELSAPLAPRVTAVMPVLREVLRSKDRRLQTAVLDGLCNVGPVAVDALAEVMTLLSMTDEEAVP